jgi:hypothetical protein
MVGMGCSYCEIAETLSISVFTAKRHAEDAAAKIPGDLPTQIKLIMWVRGVPLDALDGSSLRQTIACGDESLVDRSDNAMLNMAIDPKRHSGSHR